MQALCQWEAQPEQPEHMLQEFLSDEALPKPAENYAVNLVRCFWRLQSEIDSLISTSSEHWAISRISMVERNLLRIAAAELLTNEIPKKVVINEAIEISKEYGGDESVRFVNGVLDAIKRKLDG